MQIQKKIEDIKFTPVTLFGEEMEVSENIVMASAAGWYVGSICKEDDGLQNYLLDVMKKKNYLLIMLNHKQKHLAHLQKLGQVCQMVRFLQLYPSNHDAMFPCTH